jgi:hypothetical protein
MRDDASGFVRGQRLIAHTDQGKVALPADLALGSSTTVLLNGGEYTAFLQRDGAFEFTDVASGVYLLEVQVGRSASLAPSPGAHARTLMSTWQNVDVLCEPARVEVAGNAGEGAVRARVYHPLAGAAAGRTLPYPLAIACDKRVQHFVPREPFSLWNLIKGSPLMMMVRGVVRTNAQRFSPQRRTQVPLFAIMYFMQRSQAKIPPEERERAQAEVRDMMAGFFGGGNSNKNQQQQQQQQPALKR